MQGGRFTELNSTRVLPSPRVSQRVPFGTGRAIEEQLSSRGGAYLTYSPYVFRDLAMLYGALIGLFRTVATTAAWLKTLAVPMADFLHVQGFVEQVAEMRRNAASLKAFLKRFHYWFNGLRTVRYARWATTTHYGWVPIERAAAVVLQSAGAQGTAVSALPDAESLLNAYRQLDRAMF
jgi:hypothetical protein